MPRGFSTRIPRFRVTIAAYAMAKVFPPMRCGIDLDWSGMGTAISVTLQHASGKSSREEIARCVAVNRKSEE